MSEAKHTPAPWRIQRGQWNVDHADNSHHSIGSIVGGEEGYYVASLENAAEQEANAHLIAAAPDLLALAIEIRDHLYAKQDWTRVRDMARTAIAKAEGRA